MVRAALLLIVTIGCTPAQAPTARKVGKVMAIGGVSGLIAASIANYFTTDHTRPVVVAFSLTSTIGVGMYAAGELSGASVESETLPQRHRRWARILTDRAHGYARDGRCWRVRHIETRVRVYDRILHGGVFMRDPEIQKCLANEPPAAPRPAEPPAQPLEPPTVPVDVE